MKKMTLLLFIGIILTSCSNEEGISNKNSNLNSGEYVLLIPLSSPINTIELNNEIYIFYNDDEANDQTGGFGQSNKLSKINNEGLIEWTKEIPLNNYPDLSTITTTNNFLNFFYQYNGEFKLMKFDLAGNFVEENSIISEYFNTVQKNENDFNLIRHTSNGIISKKYSFLGELIETIEINLTIETPNSSKTILKNDKTYLFSVSDFNGNNPFFYDNFFCKTFNQNTLINTLNVNTSQKTSNYGLSKVFNNGNLLMHFNDNDNTELKLLSQDGIEIANNSFELNYIGNSFLDSSENISIVGNYKETSNSIRTHITILDSNLDIVSQRLLGVNNYNNFRIAFESNNHYYIVGLTDSRTGDFDLPNNSSGTDMFIYKLKK